MNLEDSPWIQVHFTLPNQTTRRRLVICEGERRRVRNTIQGKQSFLAKKSKKERRASYDRRKNQKISKQTDAGTNISSSSILKPSNIATQQNSAFAESPHETDQEKKFTLPPLQGTPTSMLSCHGQQYKSSSAENIREKRTEKYTKSIEKYKTLSIATCYDLCEWKPSSSVFHNPTRSLVSILKQNPSQRQEKRPKDMKGQTMDTSDTSGYETDNEKRLKTIKRVRFANGTIFHSSKGRRRLTNTKSSDCLPEETDFGESKVFQDLQGLSFSEFIHKKRHERSLASKSINKDRNHLTFLKEEKCQVKMKEGKKNRTKCDQYTLLPTIIN